ncbi:LPXTG cell wall anchor domain-containing protein [Mumia xiangluensis]|uniref:LPXTG cell wall anchor domain-containing protein n=1 Tax=Mumia xiangluensis TaxID=1678900 RepID=A0ABW1QHV0_9ACTN
MRKNPWGRPAKALALAAAIALAAVPVSIGAPAQGQEPGTLSLFKRIENLDSGASEGRRQLWEMHATHVATGEELSGDGLNGFQSRTVPDGDYVISESGGVDGYRFQDWSCSDGFESTDPSPTITVPPGGNLTCTVDNEAIEPTLTLVKNVFGGGSAVPADFQLTAQGPTTVTGPGNSEAVTNQKVRIGTYTLSEAGPTGFDAGPWICNATSSDGTTQDLVVTNDQVTIGLDQAVRCEISNTADLPHLTLVKDVVNDGGGTADRTDWTLTAQSPSQVVSGTSGSADVSHVSVDTGTYTLSESPGPEGYDASDWVCTNDGDPVAVVDSSVTIGVDDNLTCTVTNTWTGGRLTLFKVVEGGSASPSAWTLSASSETGQLSGTDGVSGGLPAGTYDLAEADGPTGYELTEWVCIPASALSGTTVTITRGESVTCDAVNTWVPPHLTLIKQVVGGPDPADAWTLTARSPDGTVISGASGSNDVSHVTVPVGPYALSESGPTPALYDASDWTCTVNGEPRPVVGGVVTLVSPSEDVVCTITNTWQGANLTLEKDLDNGEGGSAEPTDWTLTAVGETTHAGPTGSDEVTDVPVAPGTYDLSESGGPPGFASDGWTCTGGTLDGSVLTLEAGDDVTCTVENRWVGSFLTLVKVVDPEDAAPQEWMLSATGGPETGGTTFSGQSAGTAVTRVPVPPGDYALAESGGPDGYVLDGWQCTGADIAGAVVTVPTEAEVTCTATNLWAGPILTLVKAVDGGAADPTDWTLSATGPQTVSGTTGDNVVTRASLTAGTYELAESGGPDGYEAGPWSCEGDGTLEGDAITLEDGDEATCTITNTFDDTPPTTAPTTPPTTAPTEPTTAPTASTPPTTATPTGDGGTDDGAGTGGAGDGLPSTGTTIAMSAIVVAAALLLGGAVLIVGGRRRHDDEA